MALCLTQPSRRASAAGEGAVHTSSGAGTDQVARADQRGRGRLCDGRHGRRHRVVTRPVAWLTQWACSLCTEAEARAGAYWSRNSALRPSIACTTPNAHAARPRSRAMVRTARTAIPRGWAEPLALVLVPAHFGLLRPQGRLAGVGLGTVGSQFAARGGERRCGEEQHSPLSVREDRRLHGVLPDLAGPRSERDAAHATTAFPQ